MIEVNPILCGFSVLRDYEGLGTGKKIQLQVPAGSWIWIDSDIVSCNNRDVWDSQNAQKRFLAVKNYFKEMFHCYVWRCLCMWHGLWRYKLWFLHHYTKRMAHGGCPSSNNHKTWTRRQTLQKLEFKGWNLKPNNPSWISLLLGELSQKLCLWVPSRYQQRRGKWWSLTRYKYASF